MPKRIHLCPIAAVKFCSFVKHSLIVIFSVILASTVVNFSIVVSLFTFQAPIHESHPFLSGCYCISEECWHLIAHQIDETSQLPQHFLGPWEFDRWICRLPNTFQCQLFYQTMCIVSWTSSRQSLIKQIEIIKAKIHDSIVPCHHVQWHSSTMFLLIEIGSVKISCSLEYTRTGQVCDESSGSVLLVWFSVYHIYPKSNWLCTVIGIRLVLLGHYSDEVNNVSHHPQTHDY